jgi:hypothetical protein
MIKLGLLRSHFARIETKVMSTVNNNKAITLNRSLGFLVTVSIDFSRLFYSSMYLPVPDRAQGWAGTLQNYQGLEL